VTKVGVAVVGLGYWGPNLAKSIELTGKGELLWLCELDEERLAAVGAKYPAAQTTRAIEQVLADPAVDAVVISTPVSHHHALAKRALLAGKHVLVEKPLAASAAECEDLIDVARRAERILMVGHVFEFNPGIVALKGLIDGGDLGRVCHFSFERTNLGPVRTDVNALWDLASHDISIMCYLLDSAPQNVTARGQAVLNPRIEDAVFATFTFPGNVLGHVHASWLNPRKVRNITVVGDRRMAHFDDLDLKAPIKIYDKRVEAGPRAAAVYDSFLTHKTMVVDGGVLVPPVEMSPPLQAECDHFLECVRSGGEPRTGGASGLRVVHALEAAMRSMRNESRLIGVGSGVANDAVRTTTDLP